MLPTVEHPTIAHEAPTAQHTRPAPPVGQRPSAPAASPWRRWSLLLRLLGVAVAFAGGIMLWLLMPPLTSTLLVLVLVGGLVVWALGAALLLRSWWALLLLPVVFSIDTFVAAAYQAHGIALQHWFDFSGIDLDFLYWFPMIVGMPLVLGALVGTAIGKRIEARLRR